MPKVIIEFGLVAMVHNLRILAKLITAIIETTTIFDYQNLFTPIHFKQRACLTFAC